MKKTLFIVALATGLVFVCGCQSNSRWKYNYKFQTRKITIITDPVGGTVTCKNFCQPSTYLGITPIKDQPVVVITTAKMKNLSYKQTEQLMKATGGDVLVRIEKEGYIPYEGYLSTDAKKTLSHNITLQRK